MIWADASTAANGTYAQESTSATANVHWFDIQWQPQYTYQTVDSTSDTHTWYETRIYVPTNGTQTIHWEEFDGNDYWQPMNGGEHIPLTPPDPIKQLEKELKSLTAEELARFDIDELPPITEELMEQIEETSKKFLDECLSSEERKFFDEEGHIKIKSRKFEDVYYVVKVKKHGMIHRFVKGEHERTMCYQAKWKVPMYDQVATKVLDLKHDEEGVLRVCGVPLTN